MCFAQIMVRTPEHERRVAVQKVFSDGRPTEMHFVKALHLAKWIDYFVYSRWKIAPD